MKDLLKEKGYKVTPARLAILEVFYKNKMPLDAEIVYKKLLKTKRIKKINAVTVYRTLSALERGEILERVDLRKDSVFFELKDKHHHHIVCTNCNLVEDFKNLEIEKIIEKIRERIVEKSSKFKNVKEHSLELFGLCAKCLPV